MGQIVSDDFNSGSSLSANWTVVVGSYTVGSGKANTNSASADNLAVYSGASWTGGADQYAEVTMSARAASTDCGPWVRGSSSTEGQGYYYGTNYNDSSSTLGASVDCIMFAITAGPTFGQIGSTANYAVSANDVLRIEASGTNITAKLNGVTKHGPTSNASTATGKPSMFGFGSGDQFDLFTAGDFSSVVVSMWLRPPVMPDFSTQLVSV